MDRNVLLAIGLTTLAGLSTGIGSAIASFTQRNNTAFLSATLGFSAGVMIYVSFLELLPSARQLLTAGYGQLHGSWLMHGGFFAGVGLILLIDYAVPVEHNPHHARLAKEMGQPAEDHELQRIGLLTALAITIHNFPEGIATFMSTIEHPMVGVTIAIAIALHNIPEGISIAVPIYFATGSRHRAFWYSFATGLAEPIGAVIAYLALRPFLNDLLQGVVLATVAGIMVFISLDQLIPNAKKYGSGHQAVYGLIAGMGLMALTLVMLS
ncbi:MAG TPA: zinc transporter ZupT [Gammaproteobacteria bacterium]